MNPSMRPDYETRRPPPLFPEFPILFKSQSPRAVRAIPRHSVAGQFPPSEIPALRKPSLVHVWPLGTCWSGQVTSLGP